MCSRERNWTTEKKVPCSTWRDSWSQIVMVCAALHNLCKERNLELPDEQGIGVEDQPDEPNHIQPIQPAQVRNGLLYRDNFANLHFR